MVPTDALGAVVISEGSLAHLHSGFVRFVADFRQAPGGAEILAEMKREAVVLDKAAQPGAEKLLGADLTLGAAAYVTPAEVLVLILPVTDEAAFIKTANGEKNGELATYDGGNTMCKMMSGYYICADSEDAIATIGKGGGMAPPQRPDTRGHVELYVSGKALAETMSGGPLPPVKELRAATVLEPGGMTARLWLDTEVPQAYRTFDAPPLLDGVAQKSPTGLLSIRFGPFLEELLREIPADVRDDQGPFGLTPGAMLEVLTGDLAAYTLPGAIGGVIRVGVTSTQPFEMLLPLCSKIPPQIGKGTLENNRCNFEVTPPGAFPIKGSVWLDGNAVSVGLGDHEGKRGNTPALAKIAADILDGGWNVAAWGKGSFVKYIKAMTQLPEVQKELATPQAQMALWSMLHLSEFGLAIGASDDGVRAIYRLRTTWSNPEAVTKALEPLVARVAKSDLGAIDEIVALGKKHPSSPLAFDLDAGVGVSAPLLLIGVTAAVAVPAFMKYIKKSKTSEARMFVRRISDSARELQAQAGAFPAASTPITPPLGACCSQAEKCVPDPTLWQHPTWVALEFSIEDPHYYSYQYEVGADGKSFTARAFGDLDCDGDYSTFKMHNEMGGPSPALFRNQELE